MTRIVYADGSTVDYEYDQGPNSIGRLTRVTDASGTTDFAYDSQGRVTAETRTMGGKAFSTLYSYDSGGRLAVLTYPSGSTLTYFRDAIGRIVRIDMTKSNGAPRTVAKNVTYRPFAGVQSFVNGAGRTVQRNFDLNGRITSYSLRGLPQIVSYDAASRITSIWDTADAAKVNSYGYDNLDRLTQFISPAINQGFTYDASGNRTGQTLGSGSYAYLVAANSNRLLQVSSSSAVQAYSYDANGSMSANGANQFTYDAHGRLVAAATSLGLVQYRINAFGQRVQKTGAAGATLFHYDRDGRLIGESTADGVFVKEYVYLNDIPVAVLTP